MCGRAYETYTDEELELRYLNETNKRNPLGLTPNYNLAPTQQSPIVLVKEGKRVIQRMRWGLVPFWATDLKSASKYSLINAKGEEIEEKRSYKECFKKRRCIVPLSGFIEWHRNEDETKTPFAIHLKSETIMSVAGVWETWTDQKSGEIIESFSIITIAANTFMKKIHDRMPVILAQVDEEQWLDPNLTRTDRVSELLKPCPSAWLESHAISTLINSPKNNRPEVLEPALQ